MLTIYPQNKNILHPVTQQITHKELFKIFIEHLGFSITENEFDVLYAVLKGRPVDNKKILNQLHKKRFLKDDKPHEFFIELFKHSKQPVEIVYRYDVQDT